MYKTAHFLPSVYFVRHKRGTPSPPRALSLLSQRLYKPIFPPLSISYPHRPPTHPTVNPGGCFSSHHFPVPSAWLSDKRQACTEQLLHFFFLIHHIGVDDMLAFQTTLNGAYQRMHCRARVAV